VEDASGNTYTVSGNFFDNTLHSDFGGDLLFSGIGRVTLSGPAGVVVGQAQLNVVNGPVEYDLYFSKIQQCKITS
jgi:hypothetical protein